MEQPGQTGGISPPPPGDEGSQSPVGTWGPPESQLLPRPRGPTPLEERAALCHRARTEVSAPPPPRQSAPPESFPTSHPRRRLEDKRRFGTVSARRRGSPRARKAAGRGRPSPRFPLPSSPCPPLPGHLQRPPPPQARRGARPAVRNAPSGPAPPRVKTAAAADLLRAGGAPDRPLAAARAKPRADGRTSEQGSVPSPFPFAGLTLVTVMQAPGEEGAAPQKTRGRPGTRRGWREAGPRAPASAAPGSASLSPPGSAAAATAASRFQEEPRTTLRLRSAPRAAAGQPGPAAAAAEREREEEAPPRPPLRPGTCAQRGQPPAALRGGLLPSRPAGPRWPRVRCRPVARKCWVGAHKCWGRLIN